MRQVLALSNEKMLFEGCEAMLTKNNDIEIKTYADPLCIIENLLTLQSELIVIDVDFTAETTTRIIHIIRLINKRIPIVLILSKENMPICLAVFSRGAISYLTKPIAPQNLCDLISSTLKINH